MVSRIVSSKLAPARTRSSRRSFTLVELLVVIAILAILMAIAVYGVLAAIEAGRVSKAQQTIQMLTVGIDGYKTRFGGVPPVSLNEYDSSMGHNNINGGIESLLLSLRTTRDGPALIDITQFEDSLENRDGDQSPQAYEFLAVTGRPELFELVDPWGNPYVYVPQALDSQGNPYQRTFTYIDKNGNQVTVDPQMWTRHSTSGQWPQEYMIWSFGPDGVNMNGLGDDVISWTKGRDERRLNPSDVGTYEE